MTFQLVKDRDEDVHETEVTSVTVTCFLMAFQMVKDREEEVREAENDQRMETIQDRFPYDDLQLRDKDKVQGGQDSCPPFLSLLQSKVWNCGVTHGSQYGSLLLK